MVKESNAQGKCYINYVCMMIFEVMQLFGEGTLKTKKPHKNWISFKI